jgi:hypothetical protein
MWAFIEKIIVLFVIEKIKNDKLFGNEKIGF